MNILGCDSSGQRGVGEGIHMNICLILSACRDRAVWKCSIPNYLKFLSLGFEEE